MARGKNKARTANRKRAQAESTIAQLKEELASEMQLIEDVAEAQREAQQARTSIRNETEGLVEVSQPKEERLRDEIAYLQETLTALRGSRRELAKAWDRYSDHLIGKMPGSTGTERLEAFFRLLTGNEMLYSGDEAPRLSVEKMLSLQQARGERGASRSEEDLSGGIDLVRRFLRPRLSRRLGEAGLDEGPLPSQAVWSEEQRHLLEDEVFPVARKIWESSSPTLDLDCMPVWGAGPLVRREGAESSLLERLGARGVNPALHGGDAEVPPLPLPSLSARTRSAVALLGPDRVVEAWRSSLRTRQALVKALTGEVSPFIARPAHARPSQGAVLQHLYSLSALGEWLRREGEDPGVALAATGLTAAATYWLPAGQTASFADSDPVDEIAQEEMTLPFPQVFLAFAEPLVLEATEPLDQSLASAVDVMSVVAREARTRREMASRVLRHSLHGIPGKELPYIEDAIAQIGARVEGVLLLSDDLGRPLDEFAWCLSLDSKYGESIGRIVVPARRSATAHRDLITNLLAVTAWANWHSPDSRTEVPLGMKPDDVEGLIHSRDFQNDARRAGAGVRVIDTVRTRRGGIREKASQGDRHVDPHIRRGHWRRQRHGKGLSMVRMVRISPVLVNAHLGEVEGPRVYRIK